MKRLRDIIIEKHNEEGYKLHNLLQKHGFQHKFGVQYGRGDHKVYISGIGAWNYKHTKTGHQKAGKGEKDLDSHLKGLTEDIAINSASGGDVEGLGENPPVGKRRNPRLFGIVRRRLSAQSIKKGKKNVGGRR